MANRPKKQKRAKTGGRQTKFPGATLQVSLKLTPKTNALIQRVQSERTLADGFNCSFAGAVSWCVYQATGTPLPKVTP